MNTSGDRRFAERTPDPGKRLLTLLTLLTTGALAACSADPPPPDPPPSGATLDVSVTELPAGAAARMHLTGPGTDVRLDGPRRFDNVVPGRYALDVEPVPLPDNRTSYPAA